MKKIVFVCVQFLVLCSLFLYGQQEFSPYVSTQYEITDGLPQHVIIDIVKRKNGEINILTPDGIVRYSKNSFIPFINDDGYLDYTYSSIAWHPKKEQLYGYTTTNNYCQLYPTFQKKQKVAAVSFSDTSVVYITYLGEIIESNYEMTQKYKSVATSILHVHAIFQTQTSYYIATSTKLYSVDKKTEKITELITTKGKVNKIKKNPYTKEVYFLYDTSVYVVSQLGKVSKKQFREFTNTILTDVEFVSIHKTLFTSRDALFVYTNSQSYTRYKPLSTLPFAQLSSIYYDKEDDFFLLGTLDRGVIKLSSRYATTHRHTLHEGSQSYGSIIEHKNQILTMDNMGYIVHLDEKNNLHDYLRIPHALASMASIDGQLYVGTWNSGLLIYEDKKLVDSLNYPILPDQSVTAIFKDKEGYIWLGTTRGVARKNKQGTIEWIPGIRTKIAQIYQLKNGLICLGGQSNVFILKGKKITKKINSQYKFKAKEVRAFYQDKNDFLWIGTYSGGLYRYDLKKDSLIALNSLPNCMLPNNIFSLVKGKYDYLYMSSNFGIWVVSEKKLNAFIRGEIPYLIPFFIGDQAGIENMECNGGFQNTSLQKKNGAILFPSTNGIHSLFPKEIPYREKIPAIHEIRVNNIPVNIENVTLERTSSDILFHVQSIPAAQLYNPYYQYKIVGNKYSTTYSSLQKNEKLHFHLLPAGSYTLFVREINGFNVHFPSEFRYEFTILPTLYETKWFQLTLILCFIALLLIYLRYHIIKKQEKKVEEQQIQHKITSLQLQNIQLQMNPHFIFNVLNTVIYLIISKKSEEAELMLIDFASLIRHYLEQGNFLFVSLEDELKMNKLYLEIQQRRFNHSFSYTIHCPDELLLRTIPSMFMQPFIENAILHGLTQEKQNGHLSIFIDSVEKGLKFTIQDDGIGRQKAALAKTKKNNYESKGIHITKQKQQILSEKYNMNVDISIEDLQQGTRVTVYITDK